MKKTIILFSFIATIGFASAATINIAFHNGNTTVGGFNSAADGTVVSAGNNGTDTWNNFVGGNTETGETILNDDGTDTSSTIDVTTSGSAFNNGTANDDYYMMNGYYKFEDTDNATINLGAAFLSDGNYNVTIYGTVKVARDTAYTIASVSKTITNTGAAFDGTFTEGTNYVTFSNLSASSFSITGNQSPDDFSAINGIVITSVPEPSTTALLGLGGLALILRRRK
jgi:hypothetical protein